MDPADFMRRAIRQAEAGIAAKQTPFGAVVVQDGRIVAEAYNTVWRDTDPTAHAEVNAIRLAASALGQIDLSGGTIYSTCEPCPMCLAAIHWAKLDKVVFGATADEAAAAGFRELPLDATCRDEVAGRPLTIEGGLLSAECAALFEAWRRAGLSASY